MLVIINILMLHYKKINNKFDRRLYLVQIHHNTIYNIKCNIILLYV